MIRVVMLGRLGNNLFQYAFGRKLAELRGVPLVLDASWYNSRTWGYVSAIRRFPGIHDGTVRVVRPFSLGSRLLLKATGRHHWELGGAPVIREHASDHSFDPSLLTAPGNCVIMGYFQSPRYFQDLGDLLRKELSTAGLGLERGHEALAERLRAANSVAVHVRRTDYVGNPHLHLPSPAYHQTAMNRLRDAHPDARFFVFSDDIKWCREWFAGDDTEFVSHYDPTDPLTDLHLLSLANHHIIANSSYSWWAAWLGRKSGQKVFMPDQWFKCGIHAPVEEKRCEGWTVMES